MIKVGVVGLGNMGQHHARIYHEMGVLAGVADIDIDRARCFANLYRVGCTDEYRDLLTAMDTVSIAVPTSQHATVALDFLSMGVHCLVEKPIAFDLGQAQAMIQMARMSNVVLAVGHIEHFNPAVVKLKEVIDAGHLGKVLTVTTKRVNPYVERMQDVGIVIDSATHDIGVVRYLLGKEPRSVFSRTGREMAHKEDYATIVLDFGETIATIEVNWFTPHKVRTLTATGTKGIASLDYIAQTLTIRNAHDLTVCDVQNCEPLKLELQDFIESIQERRPPRVDGAQGLAILRIALESTGQ